MEIDPMQQIQSISDLRTKTNDTLKILSRFKSVLLTHHGKTRAVLLDPKSYAEQLQRLRLAEKILIAHRELESGKGIPHEKVESISGKWLKS